MRVITTFAREDEWLTNFPAFLPLRDANVKLADISSIMGSVTAVSFGKHAISLIYGGNLVARESFLEPVEFRAICC